MATLDYSGRLSAQTSAFQSPALRQITLEIQKVNGINLGQGVCNLPPPEYILDRAYAATKDGINKYTNPRGLLSLREALAKRFSEFNAIHNVNPESEITVTCGGTGAFESVCGVLLNPGDEVIVFEPYYPYHIQGLRRYQAQVKYFELEGPDYPVDFDALKSMITAKTKFIIVNTPGNPTGKVFTQNELETLSTILEGTDCLVVTDEIYEYMTFDGRRHISPASLESLRHRTITMGGYSKTFSITGWRIGYAVAPAALSAPITAYADAAYACAPAPLQQAVADGINHFGPEFYSAMCAKYEAKRNRFVAGLTEIGLSPESPQGAYYMIVGYQDFAPELSTMEFVNLMIHKAGVAGVPSSDFVRDSSDEKWVRFCLANEDDVLEDALARLQTLRSAT